MYTNYSEFIYPFKNMDIFFPQWCTVTERFNFANHTTILLWVTAISMATLHENKCTSIAQHDH